MPAAGAKYLKRKERRSQNLPLKNKGYFSVINVSVDLFTVFAKLQLY